MGKGDFQVVRQVQQLASPSKGEQEKELSLWPVGLAKDEDKEDEEDGAEEMEDENDEEEVRKDDDDDDDKEVVRHVLKEDRDCCRFMIRPDVCG